MQSNGGIRLLASSRWKLNNGVFFAFALKLYHQNNTNIQIEVCDLLLNRTLWMAWTEVYNRIQIYIKHVFYFFMLYFRTNLILFCHSWECSYLFFSIYLAPKQAPSGVTIPTVNETCVEVRWSGAPSDATGPITKYKVRKSKRHKDAQPKAKMYISINLETISYPADSLFSLWLHIQWSQR